EEFITHRLEAALEEPRGEASPTFLNPATFVSRRREPDVRHLAAVPRHADGAVRKDKGGGEVISDPDNGKIAYRAPFYFIPFQQTFGTAS
ncbi:MAG: hypothetical protein ACC645_05790, partial [Pirellulales bacterium]